MPQACLQLEIAVLSQSVCCDFITRGRLRAGMHALHELIEHLSASGQRLVLANPSRRVQAQLRRVNILQEIGQEWIFVRAADAVAMCSVFIRDNPLQLDGKAKLIEEDGRSETIHGMTARDWSSTSSEQQVMQSSSASGGLQEVVCSDSPGEDHVSAAASSSAAAPAAEAQAGELPPATAAASGADLSAEQDQSDSFHTPHVGQGQQ
jgi:STAS domain